ncbi:hypothetical protein BV20DRAFT_1032739 [Pilatotrama ljubarskyi]|nr:hypothetical protein BV20DRAFT_1032739 [Pilatotrama ljubarskyi]
MQDVRSVIHLPYDVLLDIFSFLQSRDLLNLLCSCRTLYALVADESTWRSLSGQYGLHDITHFGGRTWYTIYITFLHTYGPMLGIWAGDHPYTGGIIEIGLHPGSAHIQGGIIVEMWRFRALQPEDLDGPEMPELPAYARLARIDFSEASTLYEPPSITCLCDKDAPAHRARFELLSPSLRGFYLHTRRGQFPHPDLPGPEYDTWVDGSKYPRLPCRLSVDPDQTRALRPHPRVPIVYTAPTPYLKPPAVSISCEFGCIERARPFLGFEDISQSAPRFYPLRHETRPYIDPHSPSWTAISLRGVWLGSHGPHGTECLSVEWVGQRRMLRAWKISGDENVPRGALTWEANMEIPLRLSDEHRALCGRLLGDLNGYTFFGGTGMFSARGYMPHQRENVRVILAVGQAPMLRVVWVDVEEASAYMRYPGRQY